MALTIKLQRKHKAHKQMIIPSGLFTVDSQMRTVVGEASTIKQYIGGLVPPRLLKIQHEKSKKIGHFKMVREEYNRGEVISWRFQMVDDIGRVWSMTLYND